MADDTKETQAAQFDIAESTGFEIHPDDTLQGSTRQAQGSSGTEPDRALQHGGAIVTGAPFAMMQQFSEEMDRLFDAFFDDGSLLPSRRTAAEPTAWFPAMEVSTEGGELRVCVDLPGVPRDSIRVDVEAGMLTIRGERREASSEGGGQEGFQRTERRYGGFCRSIALPGNARIDQAKAGMRNGVLEVTIPMSGERQERRSLQIEG